MLALFFFVLSSSSLFIIFRGLGKDRDPLQVLLWNYFFCTLFSLVSNSMEVGLSSTFQSHDWLLPSLGLGFLFLVNFSLTEQSVRRMGLSVSSVATKLSLVLPFFFSLWINGNTPGWRSGSGLLFCLAAIFLCSIGSNHSKQSKGFSLSWMLPPTVFLGTGLTDVLTQWLNQVMVPEAESSAFVLFVFFGAFLASLLFSALRVFRNEMKFEISNVLPGLWLGLPNFISYKSILAALDAFQHQGNVVFPVANLGVIILSSLVSAFYFKDAFSRWNIAGIGLACIALILLYQC